MEKVARALGRRTNDHHLDPVPDDAIPLDLKIASTSHIVVQIFPNSIYLRQRHRRTAADCAAPRWELADAVCHVPEEQRRWRRSGSGKKRSEGKGGGERAVQSGLHDPAPKLVQMSEASRAGIRAFRGPRETSLCEEDDEGEKTEFRILEGRKERGWVPRHESAFGITVAQREEVPAGGAAAGAERGMVERGDWSGPPSSQSARTRVIDAINNYSGISVVLKSQQVLSTKDTSDDKRP
ncbi:hypothetical protein BJY52DRAFT_1222929 [Lactarius psammicola]|nr:hypothetical protein BJY52DRAFT_1222929 [Lactarius psammicola]